MQNVIEFKITNLSSIEINPIALDSIKKAADANEMGKKLTVKLADQGEESNCFMVKDEFGNTFFIDDETYDIF